MSTNPIVGAGHCRCEYTEVSSRTVSGPRHENIAKPPGDSMRCQRRISAGGSVTPCSTMLAQTSCASQDGIADSSITSGAGAIQRRGFHHGNRSDRRLR